jgi:precorrin-2 methylase
MGGKRQMAKEIKQEQVHIDMKQFRLAMPVMESMMTPEMVKAAHEKAQREIVKIQLAELRKECHKTQKDMKAFVPSALAFSRAAFQW